MHGIIYYDARKTHSLGWNQIPEDHRVADVATCRQYAGICRFFQPICLIDRSGVLPHYLRVEVVCPMPDWGGSTDTFESLCMRRATELGQTGRRLVLFWSGGIDSTTALLALVRAGYSEHVYVVMTHLSIIENQNFYHDFIENKLEHAVLNSEDVRQNYTVGPDDLLITGELGDQLFGSMTLFRYTINELNETWTIHVPDTVREFVQPMLASAPVEIKTLFDFLWWMNFNLKWQNVKYRFVALAENICRIDQMEHFFDTDYFQKWAVLTNETKILRHHRTYKWAAKQFIHKHTHDDDFLEHKLKIPSLRANRVDRKSRTTLLYSDGRRIIL